MRKTYNDKLNNKLRFPWYFLLLIIVIITIVIIIINFSLYTITCKMNENDDHRSCEHQCLQRSQTD